MGRIGLLNNYQKGLQYTLQLLHILQIFLWIIQEKEPTSYFLPSLEKNFNQQAIL